MVLFLHERIGNQSETMTAENKNMFNVELNKKRYPSLNDIVSKSPYLKSHDFISTKKALEKLMKRIRRL
tara:strand:+ start:438 stop:644 length:207 start_codon:yes stop_codon:yes gene_type:complete